MATKINIALNTRASRRKNDKTYSIVLRLIHGRTTTDIPTGFSILKRDWDQKWRRVKHTCSQFSSVARLNNVLAKKKALGTDAIIRLEEKGKLHSSSAADVRRKIIKALDKSSGKKEKKPSAANGRHDLFSFTDLLIVEMKKAQKFGNARAYRNAIVAIKSYHQKASLPFRAVTYQFLKDYETDYLSRGNKINGLSFILRTLRAIFNKAIEREYVHQKFYPFSKYKIKNEKTIKRALMKEPLDRIVALQFPKDHPLFHTRNFFLASYNLHGMNFVDLAFLQVKHIQDGRIVYRRKKNSRPYNVHISKALGVILFYYLPGKEKEDFLFPILTSTSLEEQHTEYVNKRRAFNAELKEIGILAQIDTKLTSYVSRHSFATQALWNEVSLKAIQEMLGHESLETTQKYTSDLPKKVIDGFSEKLSIG